MADRMVVMKDKTTVAQLVEKMDNLLVATTDCLTVVSLADWKAARLEQLTVERTAVMMVEK